MQARYKKKQPMILFELLIALSLTAILLTFLFSFFVESAKIEKKLELTRMEAEQRGYLQTKLQSVFSSLDRGMMQNYFYTKQFKKEPNESLIVLFDNGIDPDPHFSGTVLGKLFLDANKNLCLAIWPLQKDKNLPWRKEILMKQVDRIDFEFLGDTSASEPGTNEKITPINGDLAWRSAWPKSQGAAPSLIRLHVFRKKQKTALKFAFILPSADPLVTYMEEKLL